MLLHHSRPSIAPFFSVICRHSSVEMKSKPGTPRCSLYSVFTVLLSLIAVYFLILFGILVKQHSFFGGKHDQVRPSASSLTPTKHLRPTQSPLSGKEGPFQTQRPSIPLVHSRENVSNPAKLSFLEPLHST